MKRRAFMQLGVGSALGAVQATTGASPLVWTSRTLNAMGTAMRLQLAHSDAAQAEQALTAAIADIRSIEDQMSLFRPDSALCQLNRTGVLTQAPADLLQVLHIAQQVSERSLGAFDITVQPLWLAFEAARQQNRLPTAAEVSAARSKVDWRGVQVRGDTVRLKQRGMALTLNGIAQGYAADKVRARLQALGVQHALVDAGEYAALGHAEHVGDWTLGVASPRGSHALLAGIAMQGRCVATSADDQCSFSADYVNHHIFDPRTGYSPQALSSVSVMADSAVQADAITKVIFMSGYEQALSLAKAWGVEILVVDKHGRWQASVGLPLRAV